jgi:tripartite-type tricarboxylate transporter receptor subunit TctC
MVKFALVGLVIALSVIGAGRPAVAQSWPQRPVKILVPFAAGGPSDAMARATAQRLSDAFGQPFIVENQPGAAGAIAGEAIVRAPADGYTLYWATAGQVTILPAIAKLSYDPSKELTPITAVAENHFALVVNPRTLPVSSLAEFIGYARKSPDNLSYAHAGRGSITHLAMELLLHRANLQIAGVPYKGIGPAFTDIIAGHVPTMFASLADAIEQERRGAIKVLAVSTRVRSKRAPSTPTVSEAGIANFDITSWNGLLARSGTPKMIVERIASEASRAVAIPEFASQLRKLGFEPIGSSPEAFAAATSAETALWLEAIKSAGMKQEPQ